MEDKVLRGAKQIGKFCGVTNLTVYRWIKNTDIPVAWLEGRYTTETELLRRWIAVNAMRRLDEEN